MTVVLKIQSERIYHNMLVRTKSKLAKREKRDRDAVSSSFSSFFSSFSSASSFGAAGAISATMLTATMGSGAFVTYAVR